MTKVVESKNEQIVEVPVGRLHGAKVNRGSLGDLSEMIESVRVHGVIEPCIVRPATAEYGEGHYEIIAGARRTQASVEAGRRTVPCIVRQKTDVEAAEQRLIENIERLALDPMDEAESFRYLHEDLRQPVESIATRVSKHISYVYQTMKLCALVPEAREALVKGRIVTAVAKRLARIPPQLQAMATEELTRDRDPVSDRAAKEILLKYMLRLADAPFDRGDKTLVDGRPGCKDCPDRTGNQPSLFDDVKNKDTCTNPGCYEAKVEAHWRRAAAQAEKDGKQVLDEKATKRVFTVGSDVSPASGFIDLDAKVDGDDRGRTYRDVVAKKLDSVPVSIARDPQGRVHELVPVDALPKKSLNGAAAEAIAEAAKQAKADDAEKILAIAHRKAAERVVSEIAERAERKDLEKSAWLALVRRSIGNNADIARVAKRRDYESVEALEARLEKMTAAELRGVFVELEFWDDAKAWRPNAGKTFLEQMGAAMRVDVAEVVAEEKREAKKRVSAKAEKTEGGEAAAE